MKLRLRRHKTRETLKLELADTSTLEDLRGWINASATSSVHLSLNRKDELLSSSPEDTLRSLGVTSGDLIYYSLDHSAFVGSAQEIGLASSGEAHRSESSNGKLGECATLGQQSETNQVHDSMGIGFAEVDVNMNIQGQATVDRNLGVVGPEAMDVELVVAGSKRLSEPFFLKNILLEKSGDTSELTILAMSVHAVMLESGFVLFDSGSDKFSFSKELLSVSLRYTLPELVTRSDTKAIESVTVKFKSLSHLVVVYGYMTRGESRVHSVNLDKHRFVPVIDLVMDTLKFDKQSSSTVYSDVFMFWRMVKDALATPLLICLCDKSGLELPPCLMRLPTELKLKILETVPGVSVAMMACVCTEMRYLASDNDLWKQKCLKEARNLVVKESGDAVNWKEKFAAFRRQNHRQNFPLRRSRIGFPRVIRDPFIWYGDHLHGSVGIHPGQPARGIGAFGGLGGRAFGRSFSPRCNLGGSN